MSPQRSHTPKKTKFNTSMSHGSAQPQTHESTNPTTVNHHSVASTPAQVKPDGWLQIYSPNRTPMTRKFRFEDFEIHSRCLGEGSFAQVKLATHLSSKKQVAVKVITKSKIPENMRTYACREPGVLKNLKHTNIVKLLHTHEDDEFIYMFMQFMEGGDLHSYIEQVKWLEECDAKKIFAQILDAVSYCHAHQICHRDLKLENILISSTAKETKMLLIDFGFAGEIEHANYKFEDHPGSVCYAAPELIAGMPYDGKKVDVYALGVTLYVLIHGRYPFYSEDQKVMYEMIWRDDPVFDDDISVACVDLLQRMLTKQPHQRPSIDEVKKHPWVREFIQQQQQTVQQTGVMSPLRRLKRKAQQSPTVQKLKQKTSQMSPRVKRKLNM